MKKIYIVLTFVILLLVSFFGITYSYEYNSASSLKFELVGNYEVFLNVGEPYVEFGVNVTNENENITENIFIDKSELNIYKEGSYKIKYFVTLDEGSEYIYRIVNVIDNVAPKIELFGEQIIYIKNGEDYVEPGYKAIDNTKYDLTNDVMVTNNIDIYKNGEYEIKYMVVDDSGNENHVVRKIIVY